MYLPFLFCTVVIAPSSVIEILETEMDDGIRWELLATHPDGHLAYVLSPSVVGTYRTFRRAVVLVWVCRTICLNSWWRLASFLPKYSRRDKAHVCI